MHSVTLNLTPEIVNNINHKFASGLFVWQERWKANQHHRSRFLHKARQVGADYYFVLEALSDACRTGRNKFFLSNKELLPLFVQYVAQYFPEQRAYLNDQATDIQLLRLSNGAELRFVHENSHVAALCGDVYVSEWAWSDNPVRLVQLAFILSINKQCKRTFYSSRGTGDNGEETYKRFFTHRRVKGAPAFFDTITLFEVPERRWNVEQLRRSWSEKEFEELFLCRMPHPR
ncbi:terminase large subunit domain-containing protein [Xenorhabdus kozodoii]|uniref:Oxidoreductase n=1 Tax=Xenorhabdus kozodoii TaxID=351676 RepID=A0A2D0LDD3_9GAMM|nr:terminase family protein [Xenorhabdus kozodoii]PHM73699.1 oxidoreductase [Xenorhabdus kozodoii]